VLYAAPTPTDIPLSLEAPQELRLATLSSVARHFHFQWEPYPDRINGYVASISSLDCLRVSLACPRWTVEITSEWLGDDSAATVLSQSDLETLSIQDPSLELRGTLTWSIAAFGADDRARFEAGFEDALEAP
jgi:hypothetical protein